MPPTFRPRHQRWPLCSLLGLYLGLFPSTSLSAQTVDLAYRNYTIDDGLPSSECYEIIQDNKGYIWISTDNGVSKFDGDHFTNYGPEEGLMDKTVLFMHEDHRGWIWMSTLSGNCYIYRADTIATYEYNYHLIDKRKDYSLVHEFIIDTSGNLHFSLSDHSIFQISATGDTSSWRRERSGYEIGFYKREEKLLQLSQHNYQLPVNRQLQAIGINDPNYPDLADIELPYDGFRQSSKLGAYVFQVDEHIFFQHYRMLYLFNNAYQQEKKIKFNKGAINCIYQLQDGQIIIGLFDSRGLMLFDNVASIFRGDAGKAYFTGNTISHVCQSQDGSVWVATIENGIYHIPSLDVKVYNFPLGKARFIEAHSSAANEVFLGAANGQIFKNKNSTDWKALPETSNLYGLDNLQYFDRENVLTINSPFQYLNNQGVQTWKKIPVPSVKNLIFTGYVDNLTNEIMGFNSTGIYYMERDVNSNLSIRLKENFYFNAVTCVAQTDPDTIWVGKRAGLFLPVERTGLQKVSGHSDFPDIAVRCLKVYQDSSLLIGTKNHGMLRLKNGMLDQVAIKQGLLDNTIDKIRVDNNGQIWVSSKKGLNRLTYHRDSLYINTISMFNGLPSNEVIDVTFSEKKIWVVGKQWVTSFPSDFEFDYHPLQVNITQLLIDGEEHSLESDITLDWNNTINLQFTAFNYHAYKNQTYRYRLRSTDDWLTTSQPIVNFSNLAPEKYQFEIQTLQNNRLWSESTVLPIRVLPPYWQRWWFIGISVFLVAYLAYFLFKQRLRKLEQERKQLELEEQVNLFKQKAYQAQMNPHFVFNCLNAIQGYIIGGENDQKQAARFLVRFSDLMRQALNYSRKESISLTEEVKLLDNYLSLEQMRFNNKFDFTIHIDLQIDTDWVKVPPMLIQPYVENAVLHGVAHLNHRGKITLEYKKRGHELEVSIRDNGPGINYSKSLHQGKLKNINRESLGMKIVEQRLNVLNNGAKNITIQELRDKVGKICGTEIVIRMKVFS